MQLQKEDWVYHDHAFGLHYDLISVRESFGIYLLENTLMKTLQQDLISVSCKSLLQQTRTLIQINSGKFPQQINLEVFQRLNFSCNF